MVHYWNVSVILCNVSFQNITVWHAGLEFINKTVLMTHYQVIWGTACHSCGGQKCGVKYHYFSKDFIK